MTAPDDASTTPVDRPRRLFSRFYAAMSERMDDEGLRELRTELLGAGLIGHAGATQDSVNCRWWWS